TEDVAQTTTGSYRVYPYYIESSLYGTRQLIANPDDPTASPYGWHDTNGAAGAESTKTRGNNVNVYSDKMTMIK
ncbi:MAG TPA: M36 family metallopeptidase, partial [Chitinophagales bacterium]|nr:M36 family metallopeptidase [Chitinophagales bacterium]